MAQPFSNNNSISLDMFEISVARSLTLAIILSFILAMAVMWFFAENSPIWEIIPDVWERYLKNPLCLIILLVFLVLFIYSFFQYLGLQVDKRHLSGKRDLPFLWQIAFFISGRFSSDTEADDTKKLHDFHIQKYLTPLQFGIWVLPILGFIGTVIGISQAITGLRIVGADDSGSGINQQNIDLVLKGLETAFDTTLLGLLCVIPTMMMYLSLKLHSNQINLKLNNHKEKT
jgi:preprotein translocase subunit YajC